MADELRTVGATVRTIPADLGTRAGVAAATERLSAGNVRMLIGNAGTGGYPRLSEVDPADVGHLLTLNAVAPVQLVRAALSGMLTAGDGAVITVASLLAFGVGQNNPRMPPRTLTRLPKRPPWASPAGAPSNRRMPACASRSSARE